ncbi:MAG: hypothetical protein U0Z44_04460 [Kouleothrix sp.]
MLKQAGLYGNGSFVRLVALGCTNERRPAFTPAYAPHHARWQPEPWPATPPA